MPSKCGAHHTNHHCNSIWARRYQYPAIHNRMQFRYKTCRRKKTSGIVTDDLKWDKQCVAVVKKANKLLGMIKSNFIDRSKATILALYKSLIRPLLEYCIQVWNPHLAKDIKLIELVFKRRATKLVHGTENWKYDDRLKFLGLARLDKRTRGKVLS